MLQSLARACFRRRRTVLVLWVVALVGVSVLGNAVGGSFSQSFAMSGTESQQARDLLEARFPARAGAEGQLVFEQRDGIDAPAVQTAMTSVFADIAAVRGVAGIVSPYDDPTRSQISKDGTIAYATILFETSDETVTDRTVHEIKRIVATETPDDVRTELGGRFFQDPPSLGAAELIGIIAAMIILLVVFGSVLAMGLPIVTALLGIGIGLGLVELISHTLMTPDFTTQLASMIGIGVGIDYALFIVTRYRQGLEEGLEPEPAAARAIDTAGRAVLFAGITVVISILGLFLMGVPFVRGLAVGTSLTVALVMLASITLLPALLGFAGRNIDRLSVRRSVREIHSREGFWFRWSRFVQRRPWWTFLAALTVLLVLTVPFLSMRLGFADAGNAPKADTTRQAYDLVAKGFGPGTNGPLVLAAEFPEGADVSATLDDLAEEIRATPGVAFVSPPIPSPSGDAAVIRIIPTTAPQSVETTDLVHDLRDDVVPAAVAGTDVVVHVGGFTASGIDVSDRLAARLPWFIGAVLVLSFLLLLAVFRSVLVPLKAVIMNLLSIGAAYGVVVAVFQWGWFGSVVGISKAGPIAPFIPMMMFAIVFGLSMDYEVFLLSRIREEYDRTGDNGLAVADGLAATARVITAAALIMVTVFASFVTGTEPLLKLFGLGLAVAIFIDATIVRMVLVPSTMELLGDRNWWFPKWLDRIIPRLHVEPIDDVDAELAALTAESSPVP